MILTNGRVTFVRVKSRVGKIDAKRLAETQDVEGGRPDSSRCHEVQVKLIGV
jgi:hypothetical protein